jgi:hypothetical protein
MGGNILNPFAELKCVGFRNMVNYIGELQGVWTCDLRIGGIEIYNSILVTGRVHY